MEPVRELRRNHCPRALLVAIVIALIFVFADYRDMARGLVMGTLFSIINFILMGMSIHMRMQKTRRSSSIMSLVLVLARFGILAIPLIIAVYYDRFHIITTIIGLFMVQAMILADAVKEMAGYRRT